MPAPRPVRQLAGLTPTQWLRANFAAMAIGLASVLVTTFALRQGRTDSDEPLADRVDTLVATLAEASSTLDELQATLANRQGRLADLQHQLETAELLQSLTDDQLVAVSQLIGTTTRPLWLDILMLVSSVVAGAAASFAITRHYYLKQITRAPPVSDPRQPPPQ